MLLTPLASEGGEMGSNPEVFGRAVVVYLLDVCVRLEIGRVERARVAQHALHVVFAHEAVEVDSDVVVIEPLRHDVLLLLHHQRQTQEHEERLATAELVRRRQLGEPRRLLREVHGRDHDIGVVMTTGTGRQGTQGCGIWGQTETLLLLLLATAGNIGS